MPTLTANERQLANEKAIAAKNMEFEDFFVVSEMNPCKKFIRFFKIKIIIINYLIKKPPI